MPNNFEYQFAKFQIIPKIILFEKNIVQMVDFIINVLDLIKKRPQFLCSVPFENIGISKNLESIFFIIFV